MLLAGVLLKMGGYGFIRFCLPIFPEMAHTFAPYVLWLSVMRASFTADTWLLHRSDLKRLVAYSSVSHMGFVTLGIFSFNNEGVEGAILQMVTHGSDDGRDVPDRWTALRPHAQSLDRRLRRSCSSECRVSSRSLSLFAVASFGLPATSNFIGEFLILVGVSYENFIFVVLAMGGIVLGAAYMLWMLQRVAFGQPRTEAASKLTDLSVRELVTVTPLAVAVIFVGVYPGPLLEAMDASVTYVVERLATVP